MRFFSSASARPSAFVLAGVACSVLLAGCEGGASLQGQLANTCRYDGADGATIGSIPASSLEECRIAFSPFGFFRPDSKLYYNAAHICTFIDGFCEPVQGVDLSPRDTSPPPQLQLTVDASKTSAAPGEAVSYVVTLSNPEDRTVKNIFLDLSIPKPITLSAHPNCVQLSDFNKTHSNNGPVHPYFRYRCIFPALEQDQAVTLQISGTNETVCEYLQIEAFAYRGPYDPINAKNARARTTLPACVTSSSSSSAFTSSLSSSLSSPSLSSSLSSSAALSSFSSISSAFSASSSAQSTSDVSSASSAAVSDASSSISVSSVFPIAVQSSAPSAICPGTECASGGDSFCAVQNATCVETSDLPCLRCVPIAATSSVASSASSSACAALSCIPAPAGCTYVGPFAEQNGCQTCGTLECASSSSSVSLSCFDSDDINPFVKGTLTVPTAILNESCIQLISNSITNVPSCAPSETCFVRETYCDADAQARTQEISCANGCNNGACIPGSSSAASAPSSSPAEGQCQFNECFTQNGMGFCAAQNATCTHIGTGPCVQCVPLQAASSAAASSFGNAASSVPSSQGAISSAAAGVSSASSISSVSSFSSSSASSSSAIVISSVSSAASSTGGTNIFVECPGGYICSKWSIQNQCIDIDLNCQQGTVPQAGPGCGNVSCSGICMRCVPAAEASSSAQSQSPSSLLQASIAVNTFGKNQITQVGEEVPFEVTMRLDGNVQADHILLGLPGTGGAWEMRDFVITQSAGGTTEPCDEKVRRGEGCELWSVPAGSVFKARGILVATDEVVCGGTSYNIRANLTATRRGQPALGTADLREERTSQQTIALNCTRTVNLAVQNEATYGGGGLMYLNTTIANTGTDAGDTYLIVDIPTGSFLQPELSGCQQLSHGDPSATHFLCYTGTIQPAQSKKILFRWKTTACGTMATSLHVVSNYAGPDPRQQSFDRRWVMQSFVPCG